MNPVPTEIERLTWNLRLYAETVRGCSAEFLSGGRGEVADAINEAADMLASLAASLEQRTKALEEILVDAEYGTPRDALFTMIAAKARGALSGSDRCP